MKTRSFVNREKGTPVESPAGGTFHIRPFGTTDQLRYATALSAKDRDQVTDLESVIACAMERVVKIEGIVDADTKAPVEITEEVKYAILEEIIESQEDDAESDGTPKKKLRHEITANWVIEQAARLTKQKLEAETKN